MRRLACTILGGLLAAAPLVAQQPVRVDSIYDESMVSVRPERISSPAVIYPDSLRQANIAGRVVVRVIIDTLGRAERDSTTVVSSTNHGFDQAALAVVLGSRFSPGRIHGRPVRTRVTVPINFSIAR
jgi:TonB family protein